MRAARKRERDVRRVRVRRGRPLERPRAEVRRVVEAASNGDEAVSKPRIIPDTERTRILTDLVREKYAPKGDVMSLSHVVIEEVAQGTGSRGYRWADVLALGMWPSNGRLLHGYEVKASRADLKKE